MHHISIEMDSIFQTNKYKEQKFIKSWLTIWLYLYHVIFYKIARISPGAGTNCQILSIYSKHIPRKLPDLFQASKIAGSSKQSCCCYYYYSIACSFPARSSKQQWAVQNCWIFSKLSCWLTTQTTFSLIASPSFPRWSAGKIARELRAAGVASIGSFRRPSTMQNCRTDHDAASRL